MLVDAKVKTAALVLLMIGGAVGAAVGRATGERWMGFVYPDDPSLIRHVDIGEFRTIEQCRGSASAVALALGAKSTSYECGLNCDSPRHPDGPRLCERTER